MSRIFALCLMVIALWPVAASAADIEAEHIKATLLVRNAATRPGDTTDIAIRTTLAPGWHTYWINPGDSGEPPIVEADVEHGGALGAMRFPTPERLPYPPLLNFGYSGTFTLLTSLQVPADWPVGEPYRVPVRIDWLVCEEICIPEGGSAELVIPTGPLTTPDSAVAFTFMQAEWALPKKSAAEATYSREGSDIYLTVPVAAPAEGAVFFPRQRGVIDNVAEQVAVPVADGEGLALTLAAGNANLDGTMRGVLKTAQGAFDITATGDPDPVPAPAEAAAPPAPVIAAPPPLPDLAPALSPFRAILFAFLGGLILNLMPCVFPVLALKALSLATHADAPLSRRATIGAAYASGILTSFAVLAGVLLSLKAAGVAVGWGFQLQSPWFVAAMAGVMVLVGLNLSGVFEIGLGVARVGERAPTEGVTGSFATGCLATLVATPCTAPFMAIAVGAALTQSALAALGVFAALGLGLAAPFVALSLVPGLARAMPRPGIWMVRLKQVLAFPLYATAAWLVWVLAQLVGLDAMLGILIGFVLLALAAWLFGLAQRGAGRSHKVAAGLSALSLAAALLLAYPAVSGRAPPSPVASALAADAEPFTPERLDTLRAEGKPVFLNVTAAWCITCKVNEKVVFDTGAFRRLLAEEGVTFMTADWTRRDPDVTHLINRFGRAGVPLYLYFPAGDEAEILPQILTLSTLETAFRKS